MKAIRNVVVLLTLIFTSMAYAGQVNINTADAQTLSKNIKGVGLKKAQAIVAFREKNGEFEKIDDLMKVKGIGSKLLQKNSDSIVIKN